MENKKFEQLLTDIESNLDLTILKAQNKIKEVPSCLMNGTTELHFYFKSLNHLEMKILNNIIIKEGFIWLLKNPLAYGYKENKTDVLLIVFER